MLTNDYYEKLEVSKEVVYKQLFKSHVDCIETVIFFARIEPSRIKSKGIWKLEIFDEESSELLSSKNVLVTSLGLYGRSRTSIEIPKIKGVLGKLLSFRVTADSESGKGASILALKNIPQDIHSKQFTLMTATANDRPMNKKLYFNIKCDRSYDMLFLAITAFFIFFNICFAFFYYLKTKKSIEIPDRCKKYLEGGYVVTAVFLIGVTAVHTLWPYIKLPLNNSMDIVGPLTLKGVHPNTYILNYLLYVTMPALLFFIAYYFFPRIRALILFDSHSTNVYRKLNGYTRDDNFFDDKTLRILTVVSRSIVLLWGISCAMHFFMLPFEPTQLDLFHEGEFLTPAYNYIKTSGLWTSSFFIHGAFYNPLSTVLGWMIFGLETIGASRIMVYAIDNLNFIAVIFLFFSIVYSCAREKESINRIILVQMLLLIFVVTHLSHQYFDKRDLPILVGVSFMLLGIKRKSFLLSFIAGHFSAVTVFNALDRGAYYNLTLTFVMVITWYFSKDRKGFTKIIIASTVGVLSGWLTFYLFVGHVEFLAFLDNAHIVYDTVPLYAFWEIPIPHFGDDEAYRVIPMICIGIQILGALIFALKKYIPKKELHLLPAHSALVILSVLYFRSGLGRAEIHHVRYASSFAFIGVAFLMWMMIRHIKRRVFIRLTLVLLICINMTVALYQFSKLDISTIISAPTRISKFVKAPDRSFFTEDRWADIAMLQTIFENEPCILSLTNDASMPYLMKKPSCGEFFITWFASPKPLRDHLIADIKADSPNYILFKSHTFYNRFDNIENQERFPDVNNFILANYSPYQNVNGFEVYKRNIAR
ncbi:hypothetical protein ACFL2A_01940 [Thermodesulfobacteriota bacterium]